MRPVFMIDLFCGAGGTTTAVHESNTGIEVVACINHDANAIRSHAANYPACVHYTEDIRTIDLSPVVGMINDLKASNPDCMVAIWASLECTNYSRAKGGQPRDADSRSLADHIFRYLEAIDPDFLWIENVEEFMSWGPLDKTGRPISKDRGRDYMRWIRQVKACGYDYDFRILNSANYGGFTTRSRYFGQFAKNQSFISFPEATHYKDPNKANLFDGVAPKWKAVREVLDLQDEGNSIFDRKKALAPNTLKRIHAGLVKFVANGDDSFVKKYFSGEGMVQSMDRPAGAITTKDHHAVVKCEFIQQRNSGDPKSKVVSVDGPARTITATGGNQEIVKCVFLSSYYGNSTLISPDMPCGTVTTKDRFAKLEAHFLQHYYSGGGQVSSVDQPHPAILSIPKSRLVEVKPWLINMNSSTSPPNDIDRPSPTVTSVRTHYLLNPQWFNQSAASVDKPCFTLIARMDKSPPSIVAVEPGSYGIVVFESDTEELIQIKKFMAAYGIVDIKMRMLKIPELLKIQGFPDGYKLEGTQTEQKKYIGNSVEVTVGKAMFRAIWDSINQKKAA